MMDGDEQTAALDAAAPAENGAAQTPATQQGTTPAQPGAGAEVESLRRQVEELTARLNKVPDAETTAQAALKHPSFKQALRAVTKNQVRAQMQEETEKRTAPIDAMQDAGEITPDVADKQRRAIARQVKQEFAQQQLPPDDGAGAMAMPPEMPPAMPPQPDWRAMGVQLIQSSGLQLTDFPELKTSSVPFDKLPGLIAKKLAANEVQGRLTDEQGKWMKQYEEKAKAVREAEQRGGVTPPPIGGAAQTNNLNPYECDTRDLYRKGLAKGT